MGAIREHDLNQKLSGAKLCWSLRVQAPFILSDTWFPSIILVRDNSVNRVTKVKLVFSVWRDNITSWYSQFKLVILK